MIIQTIWGVCRLSNDIVIIVLSIYNFEKANGVKLLVR